MLLYVSFGSKARPITFECVAMGGEVLFVVRSRLLLYSGVNIVQFCFFGFNVILFCFARENCI